MSNIYSSFINTSFKLFTRKSQTIPILALIACQLFHINSVFAQNEPPVISNSPNKNNINLNTNSNFLNVPLDLALKSQFSAYNGYKIVISNNLKSARFTCEKIGEMFNQAIDLQNQIICDKGKVVKADIYIDIVRNNDDSISVNTSFPIIDPAEPTESKFLFLAKSDDDIQDKIQSIFKKDARFAQLKNFYKAVTLKAILKDLNKKRKEYNFCKSLNRPNCSSIATSEEIKLFKFKLDEDTGFTTITNFETGVETPVSPEDVYNELVRDKTDYQHKFRQALEFMLYFSVGYAWYQSAEAEMSKDWDYTDKPRIDRYKGLQQWRHDNNGRAINWPHTLAGMTYYQVSRSNNFSAYESLLLTIVSSSAWEFIVEYREVVSINDQVFTGFAGALLGEVLYQFSVALSSVTDSYLAKVLMYAFNGAGGINMYFDRYKKIIDSRVNLPNHLETFKVGTYIFSYLNDQARKMAPGIILKGKIINISEYLSEGKDYGWAKGTILSELNMQGAFANMDMSDVEVAVKLAFEGYYRKNLKETKQGLSGYSFIIAPSHGIQYSNRESTTPEKDWFANCHLIGSTFDISIFQKGLKYNFVFDVLGDYAMVRSFTLDKYEKEQGSLKGTRSIIQSAGYYYAFGLTSQLKFSLQQKNWESGISYRQNYWNSIDSRDRFQEYKVANNDYRDLSRSLSFWASYKFGKDENHELTVQVEKLRRLGSITNKNDGAITASHGVTETNYRFFYTYHLLNKIGL